MKERTFLFHYQLVTASRCAMRCSPLFDVKNKLKEKTSIVMIVSPLVALMKDQDKVFTEKQISAGYISDKESTDTTESSP